MEILYLIITFLGDVFIKSLFISLLSIILADKVLRTNTKVAFAIIKWLILVYAVLNIVYYGAACLSPSALNSFYDRSAGPYSFEYYLMVVPNTIFPLLLLLKQLEHKKYVLLVLSFIMDIGWMLELITIYTSAVYNDHIVGHPSLNYLWFVILYGIFVGSVIYAIGGAIQRKINRSDKPIS